MVVTTRGAWRDRLGQVALHVLCLSAFLAPAGTAAGMILLIVAFAVAPPGRQILRNPIVRVALVFAAFLVVHATIGAIRDPVASPLLWRATTGWLQLLLFIPFGVLLAREPQQLGRLLMLALAGMITGMFLRLDWELLFVSPDALYASRPGFGFPPIAYALYSGSAILGLVFLARRWFATDVGQGVTTWKELTWVGVLILLVQGFLAAQSRGSWIGFGVALVLGAWLARRLALRHVRPLAGRHGRMIWVTGLAAIAALLAWNAERIGSRMAAEMAHVGAIWQGGETRVPQTSVGLRWQAQKFGLNLCLERPLFGWGAGTSNRLMEQSGEPGLRQDGETLSHLHNTYLEVLFQFGVAGAGLVCALLFLLLKGLWDSVEERRCPVDYGVFLLAVFAFTLVWSLGSFRALHQDWRVFWILLAGTSLALGLSQDTDRRRGQIAAVVPRP